MTDRRAGALAGAGLGGAVALGVLVLSIFMSLPSNVVDRRDGSDLRRVTVSFMPQSWAFFTKPPNDPEVVAYRVTEDGPELDSALPNSKPENWFGLRRAQRAQGPEIAAMANAASDWTDCRSDRFGCADRVAADDEAQLVDNTSTVPTLCGRYVLAETEPVPWAFRHDYDGWRLDRRAVLVEAVCA